MAEAGPIDQMGKSASDLAMQLERGQKAAHGMEFSFAKLITSFGAADIIKDVIKDVVTKSERWVQLQKTLSEENLVSLGYTRQSVAFRSAGLALMAAAGRELWHNERSLNQNLIEANSSYQNRSRLLQETLHTQAQLGMSFGEVTKAAAALVHYGLETESTFNDNLRLVVQMEQGLGVSAQNSAQLATIVERQLKGSFTDVAHVVAQLVNDTALAGDEAVRLGNAIATAMGRLRPGLGAQGLPEVLRLVGRYESALKEVGGAPGAFQQLLTSLTRPEGIVGAGALGVSPEFLATEHGVQQVMDRFAKYGEMLVGQSQGWERQFRLQMLAEVFNTTADSANQMLIAIKRTKDEQVNGISVQQRWREQMHATNMGLSRLGNSLMALLQGALYPVVQLVGFLANALADLVEWVLKSKEVVFGVSVALGIAALALTASLWNLVRALWSAVAASTVLATVTRARGAAGATQLLFPFAAPATGVRAALPTLMSGLTGIRNALISGITVLGRILLFAVATPLGLLITAGIGAGLILYKIWNINKQSREDQLMAQKIIISKQEALDANRRARIYGAVRAGRSEEEVMKIYEGLARDASKQFVGEISDPIELRKAQSAWLKKQREEVEMDVLRATVTGSMYTPLLERSPEQKAHEDAMRNINEKLLTVNEKTEHTLGKVLMRNEQNAQEAETEAAKNRTWWGDVKSGASILVHPSKW